MVLTEDHPRTCGENLYSHCLWLVLKGSPPHLRGKLVTSFLIAGNRRITPAPAGKTYVGLAEAQQYKDHPRTCGENQDQKSMKKNYLGSPPHLRGKLYENCCRIRQGRITPAPAGKTRIRENAFGIREDHPRTCGENKGLPFKRLLHSGSPPHLRGKPSLV